LPHTPALHRVGSNGFDEMLETGDVEGV